MTERLLAAIALIVFSASLLVLVWRVPQFDLGAIVALGIGLAGYDFYDYFAKRRASKRPASK